jgi:hypothetical protein
VKQRSFGAGLVAMAWVLAIIGIIGIGLPVVAWRVARPGLRQPISASGLGPPADAVDAWLIERYQLPALKRWQVRNAVLSGREMSDPVLRGATHDLAERTLQGELTLGRGLRIGGVAMVTEGAVGIVLAIVLAAMIGGAGVVAAVIPFLFGILWIVRGSAVLRRVGHGPERARQRNA